MMARLKNIGLRASSIIVLLLLWWVAARLMNDPEVLPEPLAVARTIVADFKSPGPEGESAYYDIGITLARIFVTFAASMIAGIGIGLAMGLNRLLRALATGTDPLDADDADDPHGVSRYHVVRLQRSRRSGRRHGGGHAFCRRKYVRRHQGDG